MLIKSIIEWIFQKLFEKNISIRTVSLGSAQKYHAVFSLNITKNFVNIAIKLLEKKSQLNISRAKFKLILERIDY